MNRDIEYFTAGDGERFYLSPDGYWLIWEKRAPTPADNAHRGLIYQLRKMTPTSPILKLLAEVAFDYSLTMEVILEKNQARELVTARSVFINKARRAGHSIPLIARTLRCHHTTVIHHLHKGSS